MSPKLLIVGQLPPPHHGSNVMTKIFLSSLLRLGYTASIAEKTFSKTIEEVEKFSVKKILRASVVVFKVIRSIVAANADLCFYFISLKSPSFYIDAMFILILRLIRTKIVLYIHGEGFLISSKKSPLMRWVLKSRIFSESLGALVLGERLKTDIDFFISNDRLFVLPNCIPDVSPQVLNSHRTNNKKDKIIILYLSNLAPKKGPIEFLKMARLVVDSGKPVKFVLAGPTLSTAFHRKIEEMISDLKLGNHVEMVGAIYGSAKERLFQDSDVFVFPSHHEAFPLVNVEAMRAELPVVSSNVGCIPEVVVDDLNGYIVDPKDIDQLSNRVLRLVNDEALRIEMGRAGRRMYEDLYTTEAYEKRLHDGVNFFVKLAGLYTS